MQAVAAELRVVGQVELGADAELGGDRGDEEGEVERPQVGVAGRRCSGWTLTQAPRAPVRALRRESPHLLPAVLAGVEEVDAEARARAQTPSRIQVSPGSVAISASEETIAVPATSGSAGTRNGRSRSG